MTRAERERQAQIIARQCRAAVMNALDSRILRIPKIEIARFIVSQTMKPAQRKRRR